MNTHDRVSSIKMKGCSFIAGPARLVQDENGSWRSDHDDDPTIDLGMRPDRYDEPPSVLPLAFLCSLSGAIMGAMFMLASSAFTAPSDRERITAEIQMSQQARECATAGRDLRVITERGHAVRIECRDPVFTDR